MAIHKMVVRIGDQPTAEELAEIEAAAKRPICFDDIPEITEKEKQIIREIHRQRRQKSKTA